MKKLKCRACGSYSMVPMEVLVTGDDPTLLGGEQESRFYTCHVCGDNWLSMKESGEEGESQITFIHQMGMSPVLKRVARLPRYLPAIDPLKEGGVERWDYFMDEDEITEEIWNKKLRNRRRILKSICSN